MDFSYPAEVEPFRKELRAWLSTNLTDEVRAADRQRGREAQAFEMLRAWDATVADAGWGAVSWPQEYGGRGATVLEQLVYAEETTRARAPMPLNVIGMNNIAPAIMQYGTDAQMRRLLPRMVRADDIWCQGMSEPDAGSDLASCVLVRRARRRRRLRRQRPEDLDLARSSGRLVSVVRSYRDISKHKGISCLIVDMKLTGIEVRPLVTINGAADFPEVFFTDVRVPADALLGPLNSGWQVATTTLSHERAGGARLYAQMEVQLSDLVADLKEHVVDGRPALENSASCSGWVRSPCASSTSSCCASGRYRRCCTAVMRSDRPAWPRVCGPNWVRTSPSWRSMCSDRLTGGRSADRRLSSRSLTIAGGTTQINKGIVDDTGIRSAAAMNLELTDEQVALRDTVRRYLAEKASLATYVRPLLDDASNRPG